MKKIKSRELLILELEGSLDGAIETLKGYKEKYFDYTNLRIVEDSVYEGGYYFYLYGDRLETDLEETDRLNLEKRISDDKLAYDRMQYEALKQNLRKWKTNIKSYAISNP